MKSALAARTASLRWSEYPLGDLLTLINGRAYSKEELLDDGVPVLRIQNLNGGDRWYYSKLNLPDDKYCESGDLLFAWSATFGPYIWNGPKAIYHYHIWKVEVGSRLDKKFAYYLLQSITNQVKASGRGIAMIHMTKSGMEAWPVRIPPLDEQKRIAAILDQADKVLHLRQRAINRLNQLGQSIFYEMFGDPATNPRGWDIKAIGELAESTQYGTSSKAGDKGEFPILRMGNLTSDGRIDLTSMKFINLAAKEIAKYTVRSGDLLFNRTNSPDLVGKTAVYKGPVPLAFAGYLVRLRANEIATTDFISAFLNCEFGKRTLRGMCKAIIGMANINAEELKSIKIPCPPIELQKEFSRRLSLVDKQGPYFRRGQQEAEFLFASLQHRAFRGEL